ncbi:uncharacterized protein UV8b_00202 [Ustilaginoidea virens]|uniref:Uncharacterized protein n=1 Tax=Ustilaginoidea virens TaxID=1159556 RepID=A0A8E5MDC8_USTVR|nr:uncharacterized protein UV8b_00202 [Ustilaginoidea virens]QUC15961.1 hypothetical protein UV8b_00202 [Ustilaginoidea virens]
MRSPQMLSLAVALAAVATANPLPEQEAPTGGCTKTIAVLPPFTWGPTSTVWTTTTTLTRPVDCGGCTSVATRDIEVGPGPVVFFTTTVTATGPSTTTVLACATPTA